MVDEPIERRYRVLVARQSRIRAAIEQLQAEARGTQSEYGAGIQHAVTTILAAIEEETGQE